MQGRMAVITGATGGIGSVFARRLAQRGMDLVLVARSESGLTALADEVKELGVAAECLTADLETPEGVTRVEDRLNTAPDLEILVNAAGFGTAGRFENCELDAQVRMIALHVTAPTRLCYAALRPMIAAGRGTIINVSSVLALLPFPNNVTYAGTKSFLLTFSQALDQEVRRTGVRVQALCPGLTRTGFHRTPEYARFKPASFPSFLWGEPESVVDASLNAMKRGESLCIPGGWNKLLASCARLGMGGLIVRAASPRRGR